MAIEKAKESAPNAQITGGSSLSNSSGAYTIQADGNPSWTINKWSLIKNTPSAVRWQVGVKGGAVTLDGLTKGNDPPSGTYRYVTAEVLDMRGARIGRRCTGELSVHNSNAAGDDFMGIVEDQTQQIVQEVEEVSINLNNPPSTANDHSHSISWSANASGNTNGSIISQWESGEDGYFWYRIKLHHHHTGEDYFKLHLTVGHKIFISPLLSYE
jgi:hypothetical protein